MKEIDEEEAWWEEPEIEKDSWDVSINQQYLRLNNLECRIHMDGHFKYPTRRNFQTEGEKLITFERSKDKLTFLERFDLMNPSNAQKITMTIESYNKKGFKTQTIHMYGVIPISYEIENNEVLISYDYWDITYV